MVFFFQPFCLSEIFHNNVRGPVTWPHSELGVKWELSAKAASSAEAAVIVRMSQESLWVPGAISTANSLIYILSP